MLFDYPVYSIKLFQLGKYLAILKSIKLQNVTEITKNTNKSIKRPKRTSF